MQASSIFYEELPWFDQLSALLGHHDAKKFQKILIEYVGQVKVKFIRLKRVFVHANVELKLNSETKSMNNVYLERQRQQRQFP